MPLPWEQFRQSENVEDLRDLGPWLKFTPVDIGENRAAGVSALRGVPIAGAYADQVAAFLNAISGAGVGMSEAESFEERYAENLRKIKVGTDQFQQERPKEALAGKAALGTAAMLPAAAAAVPARLMGMTGPIMARMGFGAGSGAAIGGTDAALRGEDPYKGAALGGVAGGGLPVAGAAAGQAARSLYNRFSGGVPAALAGNTRGTVNALADAVPPGPAAATTAGRLGPEAMLLDVAPGTQGLAQGIAIKPGEPQSRIVGALSARQSGANQRLGQELNQTLGPAVSPTNVEANLAGQRQALPYAQEAAAAGNVDLGRLRQLLDNALTTQVGGPARALQQVRDMLEIQGAQGPVLRNQAGEALNIRHAIDDLIQRSADQPNTVRLLTEVRQLLNNEIGRASPQIRNLDATFSNLSRESEALQSGSTLLRSGPEAIRPEDLIAQRQGMRLPEREAQRVGARAELDRAVGTKANDITALRQQVMAEGDWNPVKLAEVFGGQEARRIMNAVNREAAFQDAYRKVVENSQTAQRQAGAKAVEAAEATAPSRQDMTMFGAAASTVQAGYRGIVNALRGGRQERVDAELSRLLTSSGPRRDAIIDALGQFNVNRQRGAGIESAADRLTTLFLGAPAGNQDAREKLIRALQAR